MTTIVDSGAQIEWKKADERLVSDAWPPSPTTGLLSAAAGKPIQPRVRNVVIRGVLTGDRVTMWVNRPNEVQHGTVVSGDNDKRLQYRFDNDSPGVVHDVKASVHVGFRWRLQFKPSRDHPSRTQWEPRFYSFQNSTHGSTRTVAAATTTT